MSEDIILKKLRTEQEVSSMGDHRTFKFIRNILSSDLDTVSFLINVLKYKPWKANQIRYQVGYRKNYYHSKKQFNRSQ